MQTHKALAVLVLLSLYAGTLPVYAAGLPDYYNWRRTVPTERTSALTETIVGPVLNQSPYENCWTFATTATLESTLNIKLKAAGLAPTPALSERYLGWLAYAPPVNGGGDGFYFYDAAIEASDVVIMNDEPSKIVTALKIARSTKAIVWQNIFFAASIKIIVLILGAGGLATMWEAVFADVGVALLAILNAVRIQRMKF